MEFRLEDVEVFQSQQPLGSKDYFGQLFLGHIPSDNSYGLEEMDVAIRVVDRCGEGQERNLGLQFEFILQTELKLCSVKHRNVIGLIGFCTTKEKFYLIYEMFQARILSEVVDVEHLSRNHFSFPNLELSDCREYCKRGNPSTSFAVNDLNSVLIQHESLIQIHTVILQVPTRTNTKGLFHIVLGQADLSWDNMKKVLKGIASGLAFLHSHPQGPFVLSNISLANILITQEFVPKIINFRFCVVEGQRCTNPSKQGSATMRDDISDFGVLALQLITKDTRKGFLVQEGQGISPHHILELYMPRFKDGDNLIHASYGKANLSRNLTVKIFECMKKDSDITMKDFYAYLLSLMKFKQI